MTYQINDDEFDDLGNPFGRNLDSWIDGIFQLTKGCPDKCMISVDSLENKVKCLTCLKEWMVMK